MKLPDTRPPPSSFSLSGDSRWRVAKSPFFRSAG
ncbi:unnamed protein product [Spirodela intermedia]|uniref:Uncharacterized protein n=1 Tax=Spirodela intermedia TaxID=51605 RepID=A0ABN7E949_SPIIN|nr:unnamed protein product [Spirodela intermedia]